ncbi:MAG TPA: PGPGW domain-containing protein [Acidimicrobiia bacterium]|nr:PGPGW domain-containing protein [Acidimicrobiia bacterium]
MQSRSQRPLFIRIALFVIGGVVLVIGVLGWFLPLLPGWLLVVAGLAILAREFPWARRLLDRARSQLNRVRRRSPAEGD